MRTYLLAVLAMLSFGYNVSAQSDAHAWIKVPGDSAQVGEPIIFEYRVKTELQPHLILANDSSGHWQIMDQKTTVEGDWSITALTAFAVDTGTLEPPKAYLSLGDSIAPLLSANRMTVVFMEDAGTALESPHNIIMPPIDYKAYAKAYWWVAALIVLIGVAVFWLWWWIKNHKPRAPEEVAAPPRDPYLDFEESMAQITERKLWEEDSKVYYSALVDALRLYLEKSSGQPFTERTTVETKQALTGNWNPDQLAMLVELLEHADTVKFAKASSTVEQDLHHLKQAAALANKWRLDYPFNTEEE